MISRRLTKIEKLQILEEFQSGEKTRNLAEKYNCSSNTITRTVKTLLSNEKCTSINEENSKQLNSKITKSKTDLSSKVLDNLKEDKSQKKSIIDSKLQTKEPKVLNNKIEENTIDQSENIFTLPLTKIDDSGANFQGDLNNFEEIVPLLTSIEFDKVHKKVECKTLDEVNLPQSVYMLVDKKVELETQLISDLPEWSFLPDNELVRSAILLFAEQRSAKRNCSRNQKVIKIPDTNIFEISKAYLLAKGITRLIIDDLLISLEN